MKTDDWFKPFIAISIIILLIIFYCYSQNGRYVFVHYGETFCTQDSRTGILYSISSGKAFKIDLPSGIMTTFPLQKNDFSSK